MNSSLEWGRSEAYVAAEAYLSAPCADRADLPDGPLLGHPSTFATLAMDPDRKQEIVDDLDMFRDGKDYYASVGKAWKRGYLLFGPPRTGKSTMIAAMANYLDYDIYDLELTAVKNNTELRRLFIETTGKSIIVIEDIDCSIDLTGKRNKNNKKKDKNKKMPWEEEDDKVTLSGLLNFIDGLWSARGGARIITIFTTNHKDKLDPAGADPHRDVLLLLPGLEGARQELPGRGRPRALRRGPAAAGGGQHDSGGRGEELDAQLPRSKNRDVDACLAKLVKALNDAKDAALAEPLLALGGVWETPVKV
ncbi:hypothetical protein SETIT_3G407400v2 [Setaria italica]|uniref:ATPase AAA-type core domain-containing protein n=1 Tax=Setaria italica TaxID=4555 RepID=K3ZF20_SETIT|nr:hypothetical protein SETIT_3G407400v2 [Setaria italica]